MKTCLECEEGLPETAFSPRGYSPSGEVVKRAPRCRSCTALIQNWDRERKRRLAWLEKKGLGSSAYEAQASQVDQRSPPAPRDPRPLPTMPEDYFSRRGKRGPYKKRVLTPEEEAAKVKREEKLKATEAYQIALKAQQDREGIVSYIEHCEWYLKYVEDHVSKWGTLHHCIENPITGEIGKAPWKVCTYGLDRLRPETEERLAYLKAKLATMPEVDLPSLPDPS